MPIEVKIFGFADDRPKRFMDKNHIKLKLETPTTPRVLLREAGFSDTEGLVLMTSDRVIPIPQWDEYSLDDKAVLTVLCAFEGG